MPISVSQMMTRGFGSASVARGVEGRARRIDIVAVDALRVPAEGLELVGERLEGQDLRRGAVGLLVVHVDDGDQVVELPVAAADIAPSQIAPSSSSPSENSV